MFLSSTTRDLGPYRSVAEKVIDSLNAEFRGRYSLTAVSMTVETQTGERRTAIEDSRRWVAEADWVVLIVAWNYGFVPESKSDASGESWEPRSVTEWEYWEATKASNPPKKCFVFLAGEKDDGEFKYQPLDVIKENYLRDLDYINSNHTEKLSKFRAALRSGRFDLFKNIDHFQQRLMQTLRRRIEKELRPPVPGEIDLESVLMVTGLLTPVRKCIEVVKLLATLKRIHDRLHTIRQLGIRRWREEVLTTWNDNGKLPIEAERTYLNGQKSVYTCITQIETIFKSLEQRVRNALDSVQIVVTHFDVNEDSIPHSCLDFEKSTDKFARKVQAAFTACNSQMTLEASELGKRHGILSERGAIARDSLALNARERDLLSVELSKSQLLHDRLQLVLAHHDEWQRHHDRFQWVDESRPAERADFRDDQDQFQIAIKPLLDDPQRTSNLVDSAAQLVAKNDAQSYVWSLIIAKVKSNLASLIVQCDRVTYDAMRKSFDDLFFQVDIETLKAVESSESRAVVLEESLTHKEVELSTTYSRINKPAVAGFATT